MTNEKVFNVRYFVEGSEIGGAVQGTEEKILTFVLNCAKHEQTIVQFAELVDGVRIQHYRSVGPDEDYLVEAKEQGATLFPNDLF